jgi:hypothetical protein
MAKSIVATFTEPRTPEKLQTICHHLPGFDSMSEEGGLKRIVGKLQNKVGIFSNLAKY